MHTSRHRRIRSGKHLAIIQRKVYTEADYYWREQGCPTCGDVPRTFVGRRGGAAHRQGLGVECRIYRCQSCELVFPHPMPFPRGGLAQHYEVDQSEYFSHHNLDEQLANAREMIATAESLLPGTGKLLDVGVGRGHVLKAARERCWDVLGLEPSESFASFAEEFSGAPVMRTTLENSNLQSESFDVVILSAVLEHLYNPDEVIGHVARVLRTGGLLYVDVPNESGLYFLVGDLYQKLLGRDWTIHLAPTHSPYHVFGFNLKSLRRLLAKHGLSVARWTVFGGTSCLPRRGGVAGLIEHHATRLVSDLSGRVGRGGYLITWARKGA